MPAGLGKTGDRSGRIHIIAGQWRHVRLDVADFPGLRPTPSRVRETLFNWLAPTLSGVRALDLCAGTGALGIEALSRGASAVQFVEHHATVARVLRANLSQLKVTGNPVVTMDAASYLRGQARPFALVFLDPPFTLKAWTPLAMQLERHGWLAPDAQIYVQYPRGEVPVLPATWHPWHESSAGEVGFALYRRFGYTTL